MRGLVEIRWLTASRCTRAKCALRSSPGGLCFHSPCAAWCAPRSRVPPAFNHRWQADHPAVSQGIIDANDVMVSLTGARSRSWRIDVHDGATIKDVDGHQDYDVPEVALPCAQHCCAIDPNGVIAMRTAHLSITCIWRIRCRCLTGHCGKRSPRILHQRQGESWLLSWVCRVCERL